MGLIAASVRRDWRLALTRRPAFALEALAVFAGAGAFFFLSRYVGSAAHRTTYFAFVLPGLVLLRLHTCIPRVLQAVAARIADGTLEILLSGPSRVATALTGEAAFEIVRALVLSMVLIALGALAPGVGLAGGPGALAGVAVGLLGGCVLMLVLAVVLIALLLVFREAGALATFSGIVLPLVGAVYFPVGILPQPLEAIARVLPFHFPSEIMREGLLHGRVDVAAVGEMAAALAVTGAVAALLARHAVAFARRSGRLALD